LHGLARHPDVGRYVAHACAVSKRLSRSVGETVVTSGDDRALWVLFVYRMPREPSTPRIAVWRKLRRLGVAQLLDGLAALPLDSRNRERLEWLADEVVDAGGEATIWIGELASREDERALALRMAEAVAVDYRRVISEAAAAREQSPAELRRAVRRLRGELRRIRARDYFPAPEREAARKAVGDLSAAVEELVP
jgi:hypothetical protein